MRILTVVIILLSLSAAGYCALDGAMDPVRIVSLAPSLTEQLYLLGAENKLVGVTTYCKKPPEAQNKEKIGSILEVDLEKIMHLQPELIVATSLTSPKTIGKLKSLGLKLEVFPQPKSFLELCRQFVRLGKVVGKEKTAQVIVSQAKTKVDKIKVDSRLELRDRVFIQLGTKPLFAATADTFFNDFIELAGGVNVVTGTKNGLYSREKLIQDDPDVIIIVGMGVVAKEEKKNWSNFKSLSAVKNNRVHIVDDYKFCSPTPISFAEGLEDLVKILHRENNNE